MLGRVASVSLALSVAMVGSLEPARSPHRKGVGAGEEGRPNTLNEVGNSITTTLSGLESSLFAWFGQAT